MAGKLLSQQCRDLLAAFRVAPGRRLSAAQMTAPPLSLMSYTKRVQELRRAGFGIDLVPSGRKRGKDYKLVTDPGGYRDGSSPASPAGPSVVERTPYNETPVKDPALPSERPGSRGEPTREALFDPEPAEPAADSGIRGEAA